MRWNLFDFCIPVVDLNTRKYLGSAFKWDKDTFITCKHVIEDLNVGLNIYMNTSRNQLLKVHLIKASSVYDLALLYVGENDIPELDRYTEDYYLGQNLRLYGYTQSSRFNVIEPRCLKSYLCRSKAKTDEIHRKMGVYEVNELHILIPKGFSGGPVFTEETNELYGMSLGTNCIERNDYKYTEETIEEPDKTIIVSKSIFEHYGLIHTIDNINKIIEEI